jgi:hypothetical protein
MHTLSTRGTRYATRETTRGTKYMLGRGRNLPSRTNTRRAAITASAAGL